jgi:hypothetical protein
VIIEKKNKQIFGVKSVLKKKEGASKDAPSF